MVKYNKNVKKIVIGLVLILVIISIGSYSIYNYSKKPKLTTELKTNTVYLGWLENKYPSKHSARYYIKLNDDKSFIWIYDDTRRKPDNYNFEEGLYPYIQIWVGKYTVKNGNYILQFTNSASMEFEGLPEVKSKRICQYQTGVDDDEYEDGEYSAIFHLKNNTYALATSTRDGKYEKERAMCFFYNKSDIKDMPGTLEEFRNQYTMDEEAHQRYLDYFREITKNKEL